MKKFILVGIGLIFFISCNNSGTGNDVNDSLKKINKDTNEVVIDNDTLSHNGMNNKIVDTIKQ